MAQTFQHLSVPGGGDMPCSPLSRELAIRHYKLSTSKITSPLRLLLITDLHSTKFGSDQGILLDAIKACRPDLILLAGDIADHKVPFEGAKLLFTQLAATYPCFYVSGNHEHWTGKMEALKRWLHTRGIIVLDGTTRTVTIAGQLLQVGGVDDPHRFTNSHHAIRLCDGWRKQFSACCAGVSPELYSILLSHRPELTGFYKKSGFDLVVAGHAHGGQVRIPGLCNGLFAPHQGLFPRYAGGCYTLGHTSMIVSRGLCLNRLPRVFNPPELVVIRLEPTK